MLTDESNTLDSHHAQFLPNSDYCGGFVCDGSRPLRPTVLHTESSAIRDFGNGHRGANVARQNRRRLGQPLSQPLRKLSENGAGRKNAENNERRNEREAKKSGGSGCQSANTKDEQVKGQGQQLSDDKDAGGNKPCHEKRLSHGRPFLVYSQCSLQ